MACQNMEWDERCTWLPDCTEDNDNSFHGIVSEVGYLAASTIQDDGIKHNSQVNDGYTLFPRIVSTQFLPSHT